LQKKKKQGALTEFRFGFVLEFFNIYFALISKNNGRIKNFEKCTSNVVPHSVKSVTSWGTAAGACFWRQSGAVRRQDPAVERHDGRSLPLCHTTLGPFLFFLVFHF
jgi:hypothetical protein